VSPADCRYRWLDRANLESLGVLKSAPKNCALLANGKVDLRVVSKLIIGV